MREEQAMALAWAGRWSDVRSMVATLAREDPANVDYMGWLGCSPRAAVTPRKRAEWPVGCAPSVGRYTFGSDTYWRACIAAQLGEKQQAMDLLQQAFTEGYWFQTQLHRTIISSRYGTTPRSRSCSGQKDENGSPAGSFTPAASNTSTVRRSSASPAEAPSTNPARSLAGRAGASSAQR